jgi:hypothetical protein
MAEPKKVVKGGFRATLSLLISIVALIFAVIAFNRSGGEADLKAQIKDLQGKMKAMKKETSETVDKVRKETAKALKKVGIDIEKQENKQ